MKNRPSSGKLRVIGQRLGPFDLRNFRHGLHSQAREGFCCRLVAAHAICEGATLALKLCREQPYVSLKRLDMGGLHVLFQPANHASSGIQIAKLQKQLSHVEDS